MDPQNQKLRDLITNQQGNPSEEGQSNSSKRRVILIVVLCLASISSAIYLLLIINGQNSALESAYKSVLLPFKNFFPSPSPTPTPFIDITSDWKIYNSTSSALSIKYPKDWTAKDTEQSDPKILEYVVFNPLSATKAGELSITLTYTTRSYKEILDADPQPGETIIVSSISATRKLKQDSERNIFIAVAIPYGGGVKTIILHGKEAYKDIFNQILQTLQFRSQ